MSQKIAIVVQRYGAEIVGGAELLTRQIAEKLHAELGWQIDVYTTTAKDYMTWANAYPEGDEVLGGVRVRRFNSRTQRAKFFGLFDRLSAPWMRRLRRRPWAQPLAKLLEWVWILLQGPYCPKLLSALGQSEGEYAKIIFVTYLYYPTLAGVRRFAAKAILIPLAHDEHAFHFLIVEQMLRSVRSILTNIKPETRLVSPKLGNIPVLTEEAGVGFESDLFVPKPRPTGSAPYLLYLGRISAGKGVAQLIEWFAEVVKEPRFSQLRLCLAGHREDSVVIPAGPHFEYLGFVDESTKLQLLRGATAVVNPSAHESLSLIVIEAMALKVPVLVNAHSEVLRYYTEEVGTAYGFRDAASFATQLARLVDRQWSEPAEQAELEAARTWALKTFSWAHILGVYERHVVR